MFQENERMEYSSQKAPEMLKNRTWSSIQQKKRKMAEQRKQGLYLAACFVGVLMIGNLMHQNSTIVKINNMPISYLEVSIGNKTGNIPFAISEGRNSGIQGEVPMEISVEGKAHIEVSEGIIRIENSENQKTEVTELEIFGKTVIFWCVEGDSNITATCTITTEEESYQYVMEKDESGCKLKLKEKNKIKD